MTIDGTNISTYGLILLRPDNNLDLPARKKVLAVPGFEEKDLVFDSKEPVITLFGEYVSLAAMKTAIDAFYTKIKSALKHDYILVGHDESFTGVVAGGIKSEIIRNTIQLKFTITIVE